MERLGLAYWREDDQLALSIKSTLQNLGHTVKFFDASSEIPPDLDIILTYGPFGSLVPLGKQLINCSSSRRPAFVLWMTEQFANPKIPEWVHSPISRLRSFAERISYSKSGTERWQLNQIASWVTTKAYRFRYYGDLHWLNHAGVLSEIAVGSKWIANFLRQRGFDPTVAYIGTHPDWFSDLNLNRDIPVLWLGKIGSDRRKKLIARIRELLKESGIDLKIIDGVEHPYVFDEERTTILNRTKIIINLLRQPWDNHSLRFFLATSNHVMVISEPIYPHTPFIPGEHYIQAPIDQFATKISYYLENENEWSKITKNAYDLATKELTMENSLKKILDRVQQ